MRLMKEIRHAILEDLQEHGDGTRVELWERCTMDVPWEPFKRILSGLMAVGLVSKHGPHVTLSDHGRDFVQRIME
jgi:predicted transcriptional regulator